jgi:hypothetical protein
VSLTVIDWLRESARFMARDRPDLFDEDTAMQVLDKYMNQMRELPGAGATSFEDYMLLRYVEPGIEEWDLVRRLSSIVSFEDEDNVWVYSHTHDSDALALGVDLPAVEIED